MAAPEARALADQALADVVGPCFCALLERPSATRGERSVAGPPRFDEERLGGAA
jgi:hypothetical protein